ncbi:hypothetical protein [Haloparvum sp. AD34]
MSSEITDWDVKIPLYSFCIVSLVSLIIMLAPLEKVIEWIGSSIYNGVYGTNVTLDKKLKFVMTLLFSWVTVMGSVTGKVTIVLLEKRIHVPYVIRLGIKTASVTLALFFFMATISIGYTTLQGGIFEMTQSEILILTKIISPYTLFIVPVTAGVSTLANEIQTRPKKKD